MKFISFRILKLCLMILITKKNFVSYMLFNFASITSVLSTTLREKMQGPGSVPQTISIWIREAQKLTDPYSEHCLAAFIMQTKISGFLSMREET
jgi:hypothetical protein